MLCDDQVGYWKDLLEIVVRMCVSPEELKERAQQGAEHHTEVLGRKSQAVRSKDKVSPITPTPWKPTVLCHTALQLSHLSLLNRLLAI